MCSLCRLPVAKNHNFWQVLTFLGVPVPTPFYRWGSNLVSYSRPTVHLYLRNFISIGIFGRPVAAKRQLASISESWAPVHNSKPSPIQRHQNRFCTLTPSWRNQAHKLWRSKAWRKDKQTDKQKNSTFLATPAAGEIRAPPSLAWW